MAEHHNERAVAALEAYAKARGYEDGPEEDIGDLLTDLMHLAASDHPTYGGVDIEGRWLSAEVNSQNEREGDTPHRDPSPDVEATSVDELFARADSEIEYARQILDGNEERYGSRGDGTAYDLLVAAIASARSSLNVAHDKLADTSLSAGRQHYIDTGLAGCSARAPHPAGDLAQEHPDPCPRTWPPVSVQR